MAEDRPEAHTEKSGDGLKTLVSALLVVIVGSGWWYLKMDQKAKVEATREKSTFALPKVPITDAMRAEFEASRRLDALRVECNTNGAPLGEWRKTEKPEMLERLIRSGVDKDRDCDEKHAVEIKKIWGAVRAPVPMPPKQP